MHAVVGVPPAALCDAGLMVIRIVGRFDPDGRNSCRACADVVTPEE